MSDGLLQQKESVNCSVGREHQLYHAELGYPDMKRQVHVNFVRDLFSDPFIKLGQTIGQIILKNYLKAKLKQTLNYLVWYLGVNALGVQICILDPCHA